MKNVIIGRVGLAGALWLATPTLLLAHEGHAGDHGWLAGALQPLLSLDHFLAGAFVAAALSLALVVAARRKAAESGD